MASSLPPPPCPHMHIHTYKCTCTCTHTNIQIHMHRHTHTHTHTNTVKDTHMILIFNCFFYGFQRACSEGATSLDQCSSPPPSTEYDCRNSGSGAICFGSGVVDECRFPFELIQTLYSPIISFPPLMNFPL